MKRSWERWLRTWLVREPGTTQAVFRILVGACVVYAITSVLLHGDRIPLWYDRPDGGYSRMTNPPWLVMLLGGPHPMQVNLLVASTIACGLLLMLGMGGRWTALVGVWLYDNTTSLRGDAAGSYDPLITNALFLVFLSGATHTLSLPCKMRTGRWTSDELIPAWPRYLAIYQQVLMYAATGVQKVSETWVPGGDHSAVYYILQQPTWHARDMSWIANYYPLTQVMSALSWTFEVGSPLLLIWLFFHRTKDRPGRVRALFNRVPYRHIFAASGIGLHLGILASMEVDPFCYMAISFYVNLIRPEEWGPLLKWRPRLATTAAKS